MYTIISLLIIFVFLIVSVVLFSLKYGISPMPMLSKGHKELFSILPLELKDGIIYELGSGWGTVVIPLANRYRDHEVIGYEISLIPWLSSIFLKWIKGNQSNLSLTRKDFFKIDHHKACLIFCYLYPGAMKKLQDKWKEELQSGTLVVSYTFAIPDWKPDYIFEVKDIYRSKIYVYKKK